MYPPQPAPGIPSISSGMRIVLVITGPNVGSRKRGSLVPLVRQREAEERLNQGSPRQARREAPLSFLNVAQRRRPGIPIRDCSARTSPCSLRLVTGSVLLPRKAVVDRPPSLG